MVNGKPRIKSEDKPKLKPYYEITVWANGKVEVLTYLNRSDAYKDASSLKKNKTDFTIDYVIPIEVKLDKGLTTFVPTDAIR